MAFGDVMRGSGALPRRRTPGAVAQPPVNFNDRGSLAGEQGTAYGATSGYGDAANASYYGRLQNFNAADSVNNYARGAWGSIGDALKDTLQGIKGSAVGAGRFDSGFVDEDQQDAYGRATQQLANSVAQQSVTAAGMDMSNTEAIGRFGANQQGLGLDLLTGRREELENNEREEQERKRKRRAGIGGAIGGVLGAAGGFMFGGPAGAAAGWKGGSAVGSAF